VGQSLFDGAARLNKIDTVVVVLINACSNCKDVGIEDDIFRWKANLLG